MAGFMSEALRWWDHWLKDIDNGIMDEPQYRIWMHDSAPPAASAAEVAGRWIAEPAWPSPNVAMRQFALNVDGLSDGAGPERPLDVCSPPTVGLCMLFWGSGGDDSPDLPVDQRTDDALLLCFDSEPLAGDMPLLGAPVVHLDVASDRPQAMVCVRLCEVLPDGTSALVSFGMLNLTHRGGHEAIAPLEPGERYRVAVQLNDAARTLAAGSRVRVAVATGQWPIAWPSPAPVTLTIHTGTSTVDLPVRGAGDDDGRLAPLPPAEMSRVHPRTMLRVAAPPVMRVEHDIANDRVDYVHEEDSGATRIDRHGWTFGGKTVRRYSIAGADRGLGEFDPRRVERTRSLRPRRRADDTDRDPPDDDLRPDPLRDPRAARGIRGRTARLRPNLARTHPPRRGLGDHMPSRGILVSRLFENTRVSPSQASNDERSLKSWRSAVSRTLDTRRTDQSPRA